jgi:hypothetical protein
MKKVYLWYVAVECAKMAMDLVLSDSKGLAGPGNMVTAQYQRGGRGVM